MAALKVYFVSGHLDVTEQEFRLHYEAPLFEASKSGTFVMGNAPGADTMARDYLLMDLAIDPSRITVFPFGKSAATTLAECKRMGVATVQKAEWKSPEDRDAAMTAASTHDIAWVRPPEEMKKLYGAKYKPDRISGTQKNLDRRKFQSARASMQLAAPPTVTVPVFALESYSVRALDDPSMLYRRYELSTMAELFGHFPECSYAIDMEDRKKKIFNDGEQVLCKGHAYLFFSQPKTTA